MTIQKMIMITVIFGFGILFFRLAFRKKKKNVINVKRKGMAEAKPAPPKPQVSSGEQHDSAQRQKAAKEAATKMYEHKMNNNGNDVIHIKNDIARQRVNVNISALSDAQNKIMQICMHAEKIRNDIERYRNNPEYLKQLYRVGVGISNEAYTLRNQVKELKDTLYRLSRSNPSLVPLFKRVNTFYCDIYNNEIELNNRNRILRTYIGNNFGYAEKQWNSAIESRAMQKRTG